MARVVWKEGSIVRIETSKGVYVLAQMLKSPFLMFYDLFAENEDWQDVNLEDSSTLFCKAVTKQFLKMSSISKQLKIKPNNNLKLPKHWIQTNPGNRMVKIWEGTKDEREFITLTENPGGKLIEKDITLGGVRDYPVVMDSIPLDDDKTIDAHETTSISLYPELNERLYLCHKLGRNVDPAKDIDFDREIPITFATYIDIVSGQVELSNLGY